MRVEQGEASADFDVLPDHVLEERRLPGPGLPDHVQVVPAVALLDAEGASAGAHIPLEYCGGNLVLRGRQEDIAAHLQLYSELEDSEYIMLVDQTVRQFESEYGPREDRDDVFRQEFLTSTFQRLANERGIDDWIRRAEAE